MNSRRLIAALIATCFIAIPLLADEGHSHGAAAPSADFRSMVSGELTDVEKKVVSLAEAIPADKYGWRPAEGVRSVAEVFMHLGQANYFLPTFAGVTPPQGIDLRSYDKAATDKKDVIAAIHASYDHARKFVGGLSDADLSKEVDFFGQKKTLRDLLMIAVTHSHEHLGQQIAYARMNGIKPPWSN